MGVFYCLCGKRPLQSKRDFIFFDSKRYVRFVRNYTEKLFTNHIASDQVITAEDEDDVNYMLRNLDEEYDKWRLTKNAVI